MVSDAADSVAFLPTSLKLHTYSIAALWHGNYEHDRLNVILPEVTSAMRPLVPLDG
jgi:hypothetical protein